VSAEQDSAAAPRTETIEHVIPHVGLTQITLYSPAPALYSCLRNISEVSRLEHLLHLGALSRALPGTRYTRWDYTVAMAYYAEQLRAPGMNSQFNLGGVSFSSTNAALQTIALCWNIGHLPGTFPVEKGVYRFLHERNPEKPADALPWPNDDSQEARSIKQRANKFLRDEDYAGLARVLAIVKLLSLGDDDSDIRDLAYRFVAPFFLSYDEGESRQWRKLRTAFNVVRHLAYLTLDTPLADLPWCPSISSLLGRLLEPEDMSLEELSNCICEVLSPIERITYSSLYHRDIARQEAAVVADWVHTQLRTHQDPQALISHWMTHGLFQDLGIGRKPRPRQAALAGSIRLRSFFLPTDYLVEVECALRKKKFPLPLASQYQSWNAATIIEPDELIIDAFMKQDPTPDDVGRLLIWTIQNFDALSAKPDNEFELFRKGDLEEAYVSLLARAFELAFPGVSVKLEPWPLRRFGLFPRMSEEHRGSVWACNAKLSDPIARHITRNRSAHISNGLRDQYAELLGIRELRNHLQKRSKAKDLRQRCLLVTAAVVFHREGRDLIEFDGGIAVVSSRSGRIRWYALESKRRSGDPLHSLHTRLSMIGLEGSAQKLSSTHAFVEVELGRPTQHLSCHAPGSSPSGSPRASNIGDEVSAGQQ